MIYFIVNFGGETMSFNGEKRQQIKMYILEKISEMPNSKNLAKKVSDTFNISLNTVYRYIRELEKDRIIEKKGKNFSFISTTNLIQIQRSNAEDLEEEEIYQTYIKKYLLNVASNVENIWHYAFTEMMNNAIEHSNGDKINIFITQTYIATGILIDDNGIGIFRKIKEYYKYKTLDDAVNELFKGKLTTDSSRHSGEGIFFTSRALDDFAAISDGKIFTHNKYSEMIEDLENGVLFDAANLNKGTLIIMSLSNHSNKRLKEVFDMFTDEDDRFSKTQIPMRHIYDTFPVSRSQARRLYQRFDKFTEIELDFDGIAEIGQGFAHEIFVVFQNEHPNIKLIPTNVSPDVDKMIRHVKNTIL